MWRQSVVEIVEIVSIIYLIYTVKSVYLMITINVGTTREIWDAPVD